MFTSGVRDFKLAFPHIDQGVDSNFPDVWLGNPYINQELLKKHSRKKHGVVENGVEFYRVGYPIINNANNASSHFTQGFFWDMVACADYHRPLPLRLYELMSMYANGRMGDPDINAEETKKYRNICKKFARMKPDIHLSKDDIEYNMVSDVYGADRYWVVAPGGKRDCTTKIWDWREFQRVIDYYKGRLKFVVIGRSDHIVEKMDGVINLVDKFNKNLRGLFSLVYHSEGCVSGVSFLMHLAAGMPGYKGEFGQSLRKPCVSIYGGREPITFTNYNQHQILHTGGAFKCCEDGGCWQSRVVPLPKDRNKNNRMCHNTVEAGGRTVQSCMNVIGAEDVIRAIDIYYEGNVYKPLKVRKEKKAEVVISDVNLVEGKEINILASLKSKGGGEQSALKIGDLLREAGWKVNFYPWANVHENYKDSVLEPYAFYKNGSPDVDFYKKIKKGVPMLFYANDQVWDFVKYGERLLDVTPALIVGINFANGTLTKWTKLAKSKKLKAVVFQNNEKKEEFIRDAIGFEDTELITLFGAIELDKYLEVVTAERKDKEPLVIIKHCLPDWRKYVTAESENAGEKIHIWQKHFFKERDTKFYKRLLDDCKFPVRFEFMEAHSELAKRFKDDDRMVFHKWNAMPVPKFLSRGHIYLYRTSNKWRDQYPRVVAEALAVGLPVLTEPRDGTKDRVIHGDTGFYCCHYDEFLLNVKTLKRKEKLRHMMGMNAKDWAKANLDPRRWIDIIEQTLL
jgi:glycosyltransferase involved in cell wall biosynthesis